jgi:glycine/D-amino acid oxidase-like deaminating enzyme
MGTLSGSISYWVATAPETSFPPYRGGGLKVDVAVLGGGITGLTTALLLKQDGASVAVIEAGKVACGVTGYTTAKVTSLHGLTYDSKVIQGPAVEDLPAVSPAADGPSPRPR